MITPKEAKDRAEKERADRLESVEREIDAKLCESGWTFAFPIALADAVLLAFRYAAVGWDVEITRFPPGFHHDVQIVFKPSENAIGRVCRVTEADGGCRLEVLSQPPERYGKHGGWADEGESNAIESLTNALKQAAADLANCSQEKAST